MRLVRASLEAPVGLQLLLEQLGTAGENGFVGTGQETNTETLASYLQNLVDMDLGVNLRPGWVPMTTFWLLNDQDEIVGVSRLRHRLTPSLLQDGGHIGYYVRPGYRGLGYGKAILSLTLIEARKLGIERALLTVDSDNEPSIRVIERNGGVLEEECIDSTTGRLHRRYWTTWRSAARRWNQRELVLGWELENGSSTRSTGRHNLTFLAAAGVVIGMEFKIVRTRDPQGTAA